MAHVSLDELKKRVRRRADMQEFDLIEDEELGEYIQASWCELYDLILASYGSEYYLRMEPLMPPGPGDDGPGLRLPDDFYKLRGVFTVKGMMPDAQLRRVEVEELVKFLAETGEPTVYCMISDRIVPAPSGSSTMLMVAYYPAAPLVGGRGGIDDINGWAEYVVVDAAIKCLQKEESDPSVLLAQKSALKLRIEQMAPSRDAGQADRVTDVTGMFSPRKDYYS